MSKKSPSGSKATTEREDRLKAALKANMARRKAQARARSGQSLGEPDTNKADSTAVSSEEE